MTSIKYIILLFNLFMSFYISAVSPNENDAQLDILDNDLSKSEKEKKMAICFELTQKEFIEKRDMYQNMANTIKDKELLTSNDALRALFHQNLITCYFNSNIQDIDSVISGKIQKDAILKMFTTNETTPLKFSQNQLKILENILSRNANNSGKHISRGPFIYLNGFYGYIYFICALLVVTFSFYFAMSHIKRSIKHAIKVNKKK
ncbi:putative signal peptide-containing protein [Cryptosporidium canis]|nr:putative signal peptide-containing protein [Cryptosporidium canis]